MKYGITLKISGSCKFVEISKNDYQAAISAINDLWLMLSIEEIFVYVIENMREFEQEAMSYIIDEIYVRADKHDDPRIDLHGFNRKIANLLSVCRLYFDHSEKHFSSFMEGSINYLENFKKFRNDCYDGSWEYRLMEALRNHVQHRDLPISGMEISEYLADPKNPLSPILTGLSLFLDKETIQKSKKFKSSVAKELASINTKIDLRPTIRKYIGLIAAIHKQMRQLLFTHFQQAKSVIESSIGKYPENQNPIIDELLVIVEQDSDEKYVEVTSLNLKNVKRYTTLIHKYQNLENLYRYIITNAPSISQLQPK